MKEIVLLALDGGIASTLIGPLEIFTYTGGMWNYLAGEPLQQQFHARIATIDGRPVVSRTGLQINPDCSVDSVETADAILVTSCGEDIEGAIRAGQPIAHWLIDHYQRGTILGSVCSGLALLAMTGLLDGKKATTHWGMIEHFRKRFPSINFQPDQLLVDEGRLLTAGGGYAGNDLSLYLVEKMCGKTLSKQCADALLLETGRQLQTPFAGLLQHRLHGDERVQEIQRWLDRHYMDEINLDELAAKNNMSTRNFIRRFKQASGETPLNYLQKLRVEAAKKLLESSSMKIDSIASKVGYQTEAHFRQLFRRYTSMTPAAFRNKHADAAIFART
ncbi:MAG: helix-turn-helix domain-containing protein [Kiritimatiellae bacterium]|nr:helix-turn-helix domain-containing protein [Kiritimatiellia bacterium]